MESTLDTLWDRIEQEQRRIAREVELRKLTAEMNRVRDSIGDLKRQFESMSPEMHRFLAEYIIEEEPF